MGDQVFIKYDVLSEHCMGMAQHGICDCHTLLWTKLEGRSSTIVCIREGSQCLRWPPDRNGQPAAWRAGSQTETVGLKKSKKGPDRF